MKNIVIFKENFKKEMVPLLNRINREYSITLEELSFKLDCLSEGLEVYHVSVEDYLEFLLRTQTRERSFSFFVKVVSRTEKLGKTTNYFLDFHPVSIYIKEY